MESERFASQLSDGVRCAMCRLAPPDFERAAAFAVYEGETRRLIHLLKYDGVRTVAPALGRLLAITIEALIAPGSVILLLAVPLFPAKQRARGYNQAELLADEAHRTMRQKLSKLCFEPAHRVLRRVRETESQFALSAVGRRRNLRGAFHVSDPKRVAGREVLLVDDIYTTGATARECARVLRKAGAAKVWVATLGRAQTEGIALWTADRSGQQARFTGSSYLQDRASLV